MTDEEHVNPFDSEEHRFLALINMEGQYSLWPDFADTPSGWTVRFGPADRTACLEHIKAVWSDLRPRA